MSEKTFFIFVSFLTVIMIFLLYCFPEDNYEIDNPKTLYARILNYGGARNSSHAWVEYIYKGKTFKTLHIHQNVSNCFETNEEVLIKIDSLNPKKLAFIPDTFIAYYEIYEDQNKVKYDTLIAYDLDLDKHNQYMDFKVYNENREYNFRKLTRINFEKDSMYYIFVNGFIRQGFLKPIQF